jgi:hypothetical protein
MIKRYNFLIEREVKILQVHHSFIHIWFGCGEVWVTNKLVVIISSTPEENFA